MEIDAPIEKCFVSGFNIRKSMLDTEELEDTIKQVGVINRLTAREKNNRFEIAAGQRRLLAISRVLNSLSEKEIKKLPSPLNEKKVPLDVRDYTDEEMLQISLIENITPEKTDIIETANAVEKMIKINRKEGATLRRYIIPRVAKKLGKSESWVWQHHGIAKYSTKIKNLAKKRDLSHRFLVSLSGFSEKEKEFLITTASKSILLAPRPFFQFVKAERRKNKNINLKVLFNRWKKQKIVNITFQIPYLLREKFKRYCNKNNISKNSVLRKVIKEIKV